MAEQNTRQRDIATATVGFAGLGGSGVLREHAVRSGLAQRRSVVPHAERSKIPSMDLLKAPRSKARTKSKAVWAAGSTLGLLAATPAAVGTTRAVAPRPKKIERSLLHPFGKSVKGFIKEGLIGSTSAVGERVEGIKDHEVPIGARATQYGASAAAGAGGVGLAHKLVDRKAPTMGPRSRSGLVALAGGAAVVGSLPVGNKLVQRKYKGFEVTASGVKRKKTPLRPASTMASTVDARPGRSLNSRQAIVPSDTRLAKSLSEDRVKVLSAGAMPIIGPFAGAHIAAGMAPEGRRKRAGARQLGSDVGGQLAGTAAGAYGGAALARNKSLGSKFIAADDKINAGKQRALDAVPGARTASHKLAGRMARLKPAGSANSRAGAVVRAATRPLRGSRAAVAGAAVGGLAGGSAGGAAGTFHATGSNHAANERFSKPATELLIKALAPGIAPPPPKERKSLTRKNKAQAVLSTAGGTAGLAGLSALVASKRPGIALESAQKLKGASTTLATVGGGIGGVGALNYTGVLRREIKAESKPVPRVQTKLTAKPGADLETAAKSMPAGLVKTKTMRASNIAVRRQGGMLVATRRRSSVG